jgi:hypothetical protein
MKMTDSSNIIFYSTGNVARFSSCTNIYLTTVRTTPAAQVRLQMKEMRWDLQ